MKIFLAFFTLSIFCAFGVAKAGDGPTLVSYNGECSNFTAAQLLSESSDRYNLAMFFTSNYSDLNCRKELVLSIPFGQMLVIDGVERLGEFVVQGAGKIKSSISVSIGASTGRLQSNLQAGHSDMTMPLSSMVVSTCAGQNTKIRFVEFVTQDGAITVGNLIGSIYRIGLKFHFQPCN